MTSRRWAQAILLLTISVAMKSLPSPSRKSFFSALLIVVIGLLIAGGVWFAWSTWGHRDAAQQLVDARDFLKKKDWQAALDAAAVLLKQGDPPSPEALLIAAEASTRLERYPEALSYYDRVPPSARDSYGKAVFAAAEIHRVHGSLDDAERLYSRMLDLQPANALVAQRLASVLVMTGRPVEAQPILLQLLRHGSAGLQELQWLALPERPVAVAGYLERSLDFDSKQIFPRLGIATVLLTRGEFGKAREILEALRKERPNHAEIEAAYGRALWAQQDLVRLAEWLSQTTPESRLHPECWSLLGLLAEHNRQPEQACRAYAESVLLNANRADSLNGLGRLLVTRGNQKLADVVQRRHRLLLELDALVSSTKMGRLPQADALRLMAVLEELDRPLEADRWGRLMVRTDSTALQEAIAKLEAKLRADSQMVTQTTIPGLAELRQSLPAANWQVSIAARPSQQADSGAQIAFVDEARKANLDFTFYDDPDPSTEGRRMHESMGGGVAVLDYDVDGWPDLYFTQGAVLKATPQSPVWLDQLFRNTGDNTFVNVTAASTIHEPSFSQGIAAGDVNNDGFPDLYVANIGPNQLFINQGDGTFRSAPDAIPKDDLWTASCAMADLNGDAIPDLYDVNYLMGSDVFERRCRTPAGLRTCIPGAFTAAPDRLLLGNGDGTFRDASAQANLDQFPGKGLGIVIGDLAGASGSDLFIANDTEPNFLLRNPRSSSRDLRFEEIGQRAGVAFSFDGKMQASMGVAADDFDGNGLLDLFVTNYANESNALYLQKGAGIFEDACPSAGLLLPTWPMLGFGTQAIDVELDGTPDLVVVNGDLDDFTHEGRPLRMRPQLLLNDGAARFTEWRTGATGDYFAMTSAHRGRGLARLDWNRDGLDDFVVSNLDEPAALVTNKSVPKGKSIRLTLVGVESNRDAVGARISIQPEGADSPRRLAWVTAGDGYMATNERKVSFSVRGGEGPWSVTVEWPSGLKSIYDKISDETEWLIIEGRPAVAQRKNN